MGLTTRECEEHFEREMFDIIIVVIVSEMHTFVKAHLIVHLILENFIPQGNKFL